MKTTFGRKVEKEDSAAAVVSPSKTRDEIEREYEEGRELYRKVRYISIGEAIKLSQ